MEQYLNQQTTVLLAGGFCAVIGGVIVFMQCKRAARCTAQAGGVVSAIVRDVRESIDHSEWSYLTGSYKRIGE